MAHTRRYISNHQQLDIEQILKEAQHRWLRPNEVCEILSNYHIFQLAPDPPHKPSGGSLFLFDRKVLRYFRKDGHNWRKKKDGKTVREAHEKLKAGSIEVLHCYYAHGEDNDNFQRRCYWMLDTQLEHIVLVHYREIKEGNIAGTPCLLNPVSRLQTGNRQTCSSAPTVHVSYASSPSTANCNEEIPYSEMLEDVQFEDKANVFPGDPNVSFHTHDKSGIASSSMEQSGTESGGASPTHLSDPTVSYINPSFRSNSTSGSERFVTTKQLNSVDIITRKLTDAYVDACNSLKDSFYGGDLLLPDSQAEALLRNCHRIFKEPLADDCTGQLGSITSKNLVQNGVKSIYHILNEHSSQFVHSQFQNNSEASPVVATNGCSLGFGKTSVKVDIHNDVPGELKKLDSFGRWMSEEIGGDCEDSLMASDSGNYWNTLDTQNDEKEVSSISNHMQLDTNSLGPSLSQEQLFSISDFSPDWAYAGVETKVLIAGKFLGDSKHLKTTKWCCMFGEVEIEAEIVTDNVLLCHAPLHVPGRVPFYVTCSNRLACSEVRDFEYREKTSDESPVAAISEPENEIRLQMRFAKILYFGLNWNWLDCSVDKCEKCNLKNELFSTKNGDKKELEIIEKASMAFEQNRKNPKDALIKMMFKDKLLEWLVCRVHEDSKGPHILDDEGQGVIHLAAALGYDWAMGPVVAAGVSPSFRDVHGRTGLHWAAYYGREETVVALVKLGAAPGAVEDPTSEFPGGRTAADLASSRGHKGIAGYLAEADLTSHLSSLILRERVMESVAVTIAAETAFETAKEQTVASPDGSRYRQLSMKSSLAAVRKSAQAAAMIQASFHANSFQYRQLNKSSDGVCDNSLDVGALVSLTNKGRKIGHFSDSLHSAAVKIQQKYRGWKGRKEFLKIRNRIVKIQAHVRGHQVRKHYKKVIWSVSILEKVVLRWRRKRVGLRGFRADMALGDSRPQTGKIDEYEFLRHGRKQKIAGVEKALARVQSMVRYPEACDQYMRLSTYSQNSR